jgi:phage-related protein
LTFALHLFAKKTTQMEREEKWIIERDEY